MIESILIRDEGKTLEFKENCRSLSKIVRTVVAFANTAGGSIVIGVQDKTKQVVGLNDVLKEEERLANAFAHGILPQFVPDIEIHSWRDRELIVITVPHAVGPYYVAPEGPDRGVYIRLGSTNRRAGPEIISQIRSLASNTPFDEQPCPETNSEAIDFRAASELFSQVARRLTPGKYKSLGLMTDCGSKKLPTRGAVLLFGKNRRDLFPDATIRCARFSGTDTARFLDQTEIDEYLPRAVDSVISFIERHTLQSYEIGRIYRKETAEYPITALREIVINAIVHADYSMSGMGIKVAIFDDRLEITNPGALPFGLTLEAAMSGVSRLRNRVIGRVFRELGIIEQWGSGIGRILNACTQAGLTKPQFQEIGTTFRVTLFNKRIEQVQMPTWHMALLGHLAEQGQISTQQAAQLWKTSDRTARTRLRKLVNEGTLTELGTGPRDPHKKYVLKGGLLYH